MKISSYLFFVHILVSAIFLTKFEFIYAKNGHTQKFLSTANNISIVCHDERAQIIFADKKCNISFAKTKFKIFTDGDVTTVKYREHELARCSIHTGIIVLLEMDLRFLAYIEATPVYYCHYEGSTGHPKWTKFNGEFVYQFISTQIDSSVLRYNRIGTCPAPLKVSKKERILVMNSSWHSYQPMYYGNEPVGAAIVGMGFLSDSAYRLLNLSGNKGGISNAYKTIFLGEYRVALGRPSRQLDGQTEITCDGQSVILDSETCSIVGGNHVDWLLTNSLALGCNQVSCSNPDSIFFRHAVDQVVLAICEQKSDCSEGAKNGVLLLNTLIDDPETLVMGPTRCSFKHVKFPAKNHREMFPNEIYQVTKFGPHQTNESLIIFAGSAQKQNQALYWSNIKAPSVCRKDCGNFSAPKDHEIRLHSTIFVVHVGNSLRPWYPNPATFGEITRHWAAKIGDFAVSSGIIKWIYGDAQLGKSKHGFVWIEAATCSVQYFLSAFSDFSNSTVAGGQLVIIRHMESLQVAALCNLRAGKIGINSLLLEASNTDLISKKLWYNDVPALDANREAGFIEIENSLGEFVYQTQYTAQSVVLLDSTIKYVQEGELAECKTACGIYGFDGNKLTLESHPLVDGVQVGPIKVWDGISGPLANLPRIMSVLGQLRKKEQEISFQCGGDKVYVHAGVCALRRRETGNGPIRIIARKDSSDPGAVYFYDSKTEFLVAFCNQTTETLFYAVLLDSNSRLVSPGCSITESESSLVQIGSSAKQFSGTVDVSCENQNFVVNSADCTYSSNQGKGPVFAEDSCKTKPCKLSALWLWRDGKQPQKIASCSHESKLQLQVIDGGDEGRLAARHGDCRFRQVSYSPGEFVRLENGDLVQVQLYIGGVYVESLDVFATQQKAIYYSAKNVSANCVGQCGHFIVGKEYFEASNVKIGFKTDSGLQFYTGLLSPTYGTSTVGFLGDATKIVVTRGQIRWQTAHKPTVIRARFMLRPEKCSLVYVGNASAFVAANTAAGESLTIFRDKRNGTILALCNPLENIVGHIYFRVQISAHDWWLGHDFAQIQGQEQLARLGDRPSTATSVLTAMQALQWCGMVFFGVVLARKAIIRRRKRITHKRDQRFSAPSSVCDSISV